MQYLKFSLIIPLFLLCLPLQAVPAATPHEIANIKLGAKVEDYPDLEYSNFLKEIVVMDWHGFRKGIVSYGICDSPGVIVKLQMKYEDSSKAFFNTLMKRYKNKYGAPNEWKGDSFGIKHIWKWYFVDAEGRKVNMILQHNLQDTSQSLGNQVKLYYPEMIEKEHLCFLKQCEEISSPEHKKRKEQLKETSWDYLIPQE